MPYNWLKINENTPWKPVSMFESVGLITFVFVSIHKFNLLISTLLEKRIYFSYCYFLSLFLSEIYLLQLIVVNLGAHWLPLDDHDEQSSQSSF